LGFKVERAPAAAGPWEYIGATGAAGYGDSGLAAGTLYYYRVQAYNSFGNSAYSNSTSATTLGGPAVPAVPGSLTATSMSSSQINLAWADTSGNETGFKIERSTSTSPWAQIATVGANIASYASTGLTASTAYTYRVRANNAAGDSGYSNTASATTSVVPGGTLAHIWSEGFGGAGAFDSAVPMDMAVDSLGEVVITGTLDGSADMGTGLLVSAGGTDIFVAKYASNGTPLWSWRIGSTGDELSRAIAFDRNGNVYVTGYFRGTVDFGGGPISSAPSMASAFLAKYSSTGGHLFSKRLSTGSGSDMGTALAVDANDDVVVAGGLYQTSDFGGGPLTSVGGADIFLAKLSSSGTHIWSRRFGGTGDDSAYRVAVDRNSGNPVITGSFLGSVDFGGGTLVSAGGKDIFVAKYASTGSYVWSKRFGGTLDEIAQSVAVDAGGNVVLTGNFASSSVDFGGGALANSGGADIFLARYAATGAHIWSKRFGGTSSLEERAYRVATDGAGNILLTGSVVDNIDFGGGPLARDGWYDIFLAKFSATGAHIGSKRTGAGSGNAIAADGADNVLATGSFVGTTPVNFGGVDLVSPGGNDTFLVKLGP
jgi:fibronectin type III domain protein/beta-propeller repeat-containing protein